MRYTEARLSPVGNLLLEDIDKNTVDFVPNYDDSEMEPVILSGLWPELLANGNLGIAVGMASSFAPHLAKDVYKACDKILENGIQDKETPIEDLIDIIKAPDFPTGGIIVNPVEVRQAYIEGKGRVLIRSKYEIEEHQKKQAIVVTEIPYKVNKKNLVTKIADLAKETIPDITEVRDESSREGIRIVIELRRGANPDLITAMLLQKTELQTSFNLNHVALINGHPKLNLSLKELLDAFIEHSVTVCQRKLRYELGKTTEREHIVKAIVTILEDLDKAIPLIRNSKTKKETIGILKDTYQFDDIQASAIAEMKLWTLNAEGVGKYISEHKELTEKIAYYSDILSDLIKLLMYTREELAKKAQLFADEERQTEISYADATISVAEKEYIKDEDIIMMLTHQNIVKIVRLDDYKTQSRNGKGVSVNTRDDDFVEKIFSLRTHDDILVVTNTGRAVVYPVFKIPVVNKDNQGRYLSNYIKLNEEERIIDVIPLNKANKKYNMLFIVTKTGRAKCLYLEQLPKTSKGGIVIGLPVENDEVVSCSLVNEDDTIFCLTALGQALKVSVKTVRPQGRTGSGVKFMTFKSSEDEIVKAFKVDPEDMVGIFLQNGLGKRMQISSVAQKKGRGGNGVRAISTDEKTGKVVGAFTIKHTDTVLAVSKNNGNIIRIGAISIPLLVSTSAKGVKVIKLNKDDCLVAVTPAPLFEEEKNG